MKQDSSVQRNSSRASTDNDVPMTPSAGFTALERDAVSRNRAERRRSAIQLGVAVFFLINIIVLYILHFTDGNSKDDSPSLRSPSTSTVNRADMSSVALDDAAMGDAVSFGANGKLQLGAGTTVYLKGVHMPNGGENMQTIRLAKMGSSEASLVSYERPAANGEGFETVITTMKGDMSKKEVKFADVKDKNVLSKLRVQGITSLSESTAMVLAVQMFETYYTAYVLPVKINAQAMEVEVMTDAMTMAANNSASNFITRLSDSMFAVTYGEPWTTPDYKQRVKVGSVDNDGKVTMIEESDVRFGEANKMTEKLYTQVGHPVSISTKGKLHVAMPWYVQNGAWSSSNLTNEVSSGLCVTQVQYEDQSAKVDATATVCNQQVQPSYMVTSVQLSEQDVAFFFYDRANSFALTIATVEFSKVTFRPTFRNTYVVSEASGAFDFGLGGGFFPAPAVARLENQRIAITFFNPANNARPSVQVLEYASDLSFKAASPVMPLTVEAFSVEAESENVYDAIAMSVVPMGSGFVTSYAGSALGKPVRHMTLVESLGAPVGVVTKVEGSSVSVSLTGTVGLEKLTRGMSYYASTEGTLYTPSDNSNDGYVLANDNTIVISKDAFMGVALDDQQLFVVPNRD